MALSFVLLMAAGLLLRSFVKLATLDIGFDRDNVLGVKADLKAASVPPDRQDATYEEIESRLKVLPGVLSLGRSNMAPISERMSFDNSIETDWAKSPIKFKGFEDPAVVFPNFISPGYLPTSGCDYWQDEISPALTQEILALWRLSIGLLHAGSFLI